MIEQFDVVIIGAGPSGTVAAAYLLQQGLRVCLIEKQYFPRFVIGESLLPYSLDILAEAGLLNAVAFGGFQPKNGVVFNWGAKFVKFDFQQQYTPRREVALQVERAKFDQILAQEVIRKGADIRFGESVVNMDNDNLPVLLDVKREDGSVYSIHARFVLDASGYFRAVPRLLGWEMENGLALRHVYCTHIDDGIDSPLYDRQKSLVAIHPHLRDVWFWLIPFSHGRASIGVVGEPHHFEHLRSARKALMSMVDEVPLLKLILANAQWENDMPFLFLTGYGASVQKMFGQGFALLGGAAGFLDPVWSSGVVTAMHSAKLASALVIRQLRGEEVDWQREYVDEHSYGANVFRSYIEGWYDGRFQDIVFNEQPMETRQFLTSIFAGYAWDKENPYVREAQMNAF